jgi:hypothetical protein
MYSPCNLPIEHYTEIFDMGNEGDVPSIQCKMNVEVGHFWKPYIGQAVGGK